MDIVILVYGYGATGVWIWTLNVIFSVYQFLGIATMIFYIAFNITFF